MEKSFNSYYAKSFSLKEFKFNQKRIKFNNKVEKIRNNNIKLTLRFNYPKNKEMIKSISSFDNSTYESPSQSQRKSKIYLHKNLVLKKYNDMYNSFTSRFNLNKDLTPYPFNNAFILEEIIKKENRKKEEKKVKMNILIMQKANAFLFSKKIKKNILKENKEEDDKEQVSKTFTVSSKNNYSLELLKKEAKDAYYVKKKLFPKTQKDNKFRKIKFTGDLLRNNFPIFKRFLMKQKEKSEKLLFDMRKAQSMEIKNIQLGLALFRTKNRIYKCDKILKYK